MQRAVANEFVLAQPRCLAKISMIGDLGAAYYEAGRYVEAQAQFRRVIDSGLVPADHYRFSLAEAYHASANYDDAAEILVPLFCKHVYATEAERLSQQHGLDFRERVYQLMIEVSYLYWVQGHECDKAGDDLVFNQKLPGTSPCITDPPLLLTSPCTYCADAAREQYLLAEATFRKSLSLRPYDPSCNLSWITAQLKINPNVHFTFSQPLSTIVISDVTCELADATGEPIEVQSYIEPSAIHHFAWTLPWVRVKVLPKPEGWPDRPPSGFSSSLEG